MPKMLYKYTTLESLALILKSQKIRLNPLSQMDDLQEAQSADTIKYAPYVFISSWMDESRESIGMWKLYSNMTSGIRIALPEMPFVKYSYTEEELEKFIPNFTTDEPVIDFSVPIEEWLNNKYMIVNPFYGLLLSDVKYTDDPELLNPHVIKMERDGLQISTAEFGVYKNTYWEFQKEKRYILNFIPGNSKEIQYGGNAAQTVYDALLRTKSFLPYYDLSIRDDAFAQMEITLAPQFTVGNQVLLDALKEKYNPNMRISKSELQGKVKL